MLGINYKLLNQKIEDAGIKKKVLASKMNISYAWLHKLLNGSNDFDSNNIRLIAKAVNLSNDDIMEIFFADIVGNSPTKS